MVLGLAVEVLLGDANLDNLLHHVVAKLGKGDLNENNVNLLSVFPEFETHSREINSLFKVSTNKFHLFA